MPADFNQAFRYLDQIGILDSFLPFFLVFTIAFAVLEKTQVLGQHRTNMNKGLALLLGLGVVIPHVTNKYPPGSDVVNIINTALPQVSAVVIGIVSLFLLIGLFAPDIKWPNSPLSGGIVLVALGIVIYIFGNAANWWSAPTFLGWFGPDTQALVLIIIIFVAVIGFITHDPAHQKGQGMGGFFDMLGAIGRGGK